MLTPCSTTPTYGYESLQTLCCSLHAQSSSPLFISLARVGHETLTRALRRSSQWCSTAGSMAAGVIIQKALLTLRGVMEGFCMGAGRSTSLCSVNSWSIRIGGLCVD